jgi:hypothetical protein
MPTSIRLGGRHMHACMQAGMQAGRHMQAGICRQVSRQQGTPVARRARWRIAAAAPSLPTTPSGAPVRAEGGQLPEAAADQEEAAGASLEVRGLPPARQPPPPPGRRHHNAAAALCRSPGIAAAPRRSASGQPAVRHGCERCAVEQLGQVHTGMAGGGARDFNQWTPVSDRGKRRPVSPFLFRVCPVQLPQPPANVCHRPAVVCQAYLVSIGDGKEDEGGLGHAGRHGVAGALSPAAAAAATLAPAGAFCAAVALYFIVVVIDTATARVPRTTLVLLLPLTRVPAGSPALAPARATDATVRLRR